MTDFNQSGIYCFQFRDGVPLYFHVEIPEGFFIPQCGFCRLFPAPGQDMLRDLTRQAGRKSHQTGAMCLQEFFVNPRFIVKTFQMRAGNNLNQIAVSGLIPGQQYQMIIALFPGNTAAVAVGSDIDFTTDNRPDACFFGQTVKLYRAVHHSVVGKGHAVHT